MNKITLLIIVVAILVAVAALQTIQLFTITGQTITTSAASQVSTEASMVGGC